MKRIFFYFLFIPFFMVSCQEVERFGPSREDSKTISFSDKAGPTKGTPVLGSNLPEGSEFGVYTFKTSGSNLVSAPDVIPGNQLVIKTSVDCSYSPVAYWPPEEDIYCRFFARYPYTQPTGTTTTVSAIPTDPYMAISHITEPASNQQNQIDLMYAVTGDLRFVPVPIAFNHALVQINFSAKLVEEAPFNTTVEITKLAIRNIVRDGTLYVRSNPATWQLGTKISDYLFSDDQMSGEELSLTSQPVLAAAMGNLMFIPQGIDDITAEVEFVVTENGIPRTEVNYFTLPETTPWAQGRQVNYSMGIVLGKTEGVITVDFDVTLDEMMMHATTTSVRLTDDANNDLEHIYNALDILNRARTSGWVDGCQYFVLYGTYDLKHDIIIDMSQVAASTEFSADPPQYLILDFKKTLGVWEKDASDTPYRVQVTNYLANWDLVPSYQSDVDAVTGATTNSPFPVMYNRGTIMLKKVPTRPVVQ